MTINEIIKLSLERLKQQHLALTPDNYYRVFSEVAKEKKVVVEDCLKVERSLQKLDNSLQEEAKRFKINDIDELLSFYNAIIKRSNISENQKLIQTYILLSKRLLQVISILHSNKATKLANTSLENLESNQNPKAIDAMREVWLDFLSNYDDSFLDKLSHYGFQKSDDFKSVVDNLSQIKSLQNNQTLCLDDISSLIIAALAPSIALNVNDELAKICDQIRTNPDLLLSNAIQKDIKSMIDKRIELDKKEVTTYIKLLNPILDNINQKITTLIKTSDQHSQEAISIKANLQSIDMTKESFDSIYEKLLKIASTLELETKSLKEHMLEDKQIINELQNKIANLEIALSEAQKESKEDYLTTTGTKRALFDELERAEDDFARYGTNYSICFFDIDHFKLINDTYGHEAGDVILSTIGKILNKYIRKVDFVGRYGGEEFLVILPNIEAKKASMFADKIRKIIESFRFIYKKDRINITISSGIEDRISAKSLDDIKEKADANLYMAKNSGRNQVYPKP